MGSERSVHVLSSVNFVDSLSQSDSKPVDNPSQMLSGRFKSRAVIASLNNACKLVLLESMGVKFGIQALHLSWIHALLHLLDQEGICQAVHKASAVFAEPSGLGWMMMTCWVTYPQRTWSVLLSHLQQLLLYLRPLHPAPPMLHKPAYPLNQALQAISHCQMQGFLPRLQKQLPQQPQVQLPAGPSHLLSQLLGRLSAMACHRQLLPQPPIQSAPRMDPPAGSTSW